MHIVPLSFGARVGGQRWQSTPSSDTIVSSQGLQLSEEFLTLHRCPGSHGKRWQLKAPDWLVNTVSSGSYGEYTVSRTRQPTSP
eukprot:SAG31_NODE_23339_length_506_cov_0.980344_1_plen_83_part_10